MNKDIAAIKNIAIIGECMLEISLPSGLGAHAKLDSGFSFGGDTLNTAIYLSRMGVPTHYVTALGHDAFSDWMIDQWKKEDLYCELVERVDDTLPGLYAIETDSTGERCFSYWRDNAPVRSMLRGSKRRDRLFEELSKFNMIYLSGITLSLFSEEDRTYLFNFLESFSANGGLLAFDSNFREQQWPDASAARKVFDRAYGLCDIALSTLEDEKKLYPDVSEGDVISRLQKLSVDEIVLKKGALGSTLVHGGEQLQCFAEPIESVVDTTAAGDSFNAAYLASRAVGLSSFKAATNGHRLAGTVVQEFGAIIDSSLMPSEWERNHDNV